MTTPSPNALETVARIVSFDTVSRNSNLACIDWARGLLEAEGARIRLDFNDDRSKANLFATFGEGDGGLVFSGHVDVVPVDGQAWSRDPFDPWVADGRLHGRGACDMKGFVGVVLSQAKALATAGARRPVHVALTYDEELGCLGIPHLIEDMRRAAIRPAGCIVGEPSMMGVVAAHKGGEIWRCRVTGFAAHSSMTAQAVNAVEVAATLVARIREIGARLRRDGPFVDGFATPYSSLSTNLMSGGNGPNIVPALSDFLFDIRYVPGFDPRAITGELHALALELEADMRRVSPDTGIAFTRVNAVPALNATPADEVVRLASRLVDEPTPGKVDYGTEAGFFAAYGVPSVICGPGSIEQAHKADEYVTLAQLARCERFIADAAACWGRD